MTPYFDILPSRPGLRNAIKRVISYLFIAIVSNSVAFSNLNACPGFMKARDFSPPLPAVDRSGWKLFALTPSDGIPLKRVDWTELPLQIDPMTNSGHMLFWDEKDKEAKRPDPELFSSDRIVIKEERFGPALKKTNSTVFPCMTNIIYEVLDASNRDRAGYLAWCKDAPTKSPQLLASPPVIHRPESHQVLAAQYTYNYLPENHLMFSKILLHPTAASPIKILASSNSEQMMRADIKNFFTLVFDKDDVESELVNTRVGPVGLVGRLTFFLRILFFRVDLKLNTDVSFYGDSAYVPMVINFPTDAPSNVNPASGILFTYDVDPEKMRWLSTEKDIPSLRPDLVKKGVGELVNIGRRYCGSKGCQFAVRGKIDDYEWAMNFVIPKKVLDQGFFPMWTTDYSGSLQDLGWDDDAKPNPKRVGFYLETSGLAKGEHGYDFWIQIGTKDRPLREVCPVPLLAGRTIVR